MAEGSIDDLVSSGRVVAAQYSIIKSILSNLDIHNLKNCQEVCKQWDKVGSIIRKERLKSRPAVLFWQGKKDSYFKGETKSYDGITDPKFFESPSHLQFAEDLEKFKSRLMFDPDQIIVFSSAVTETESVDSWFIDNSLLATYFPGATITGTELRGLVGTTANVKEDCTIEYSTQEKENYPNCVPCASLLFLPKWPGVTFSPFVLRPNFTSQEEIFARIKEPSSKVSAVILLTNSIHQYHSPDRDFIKSLRKLYPEVCVSGGVSQLNWSTEFTSDRSKILLHHQKAVLANTALLHDITTDYQMSVGLTVSGEGVESASVLINNTVKSAKKVEEKLMELKGKVRELNAIGFMFACCGRGKGLYKGKKNVESGAFRNVFPSIPLIGIFGDGEIGFDSSRAKVSSEDFVHTYSTVFSIISFGP